MLLRIKGPRFVFNNFVYGHSLLMNCSVRHLWQNDNSWRKSKIVFGNKIIDFLLVASEKKAFVSVDLSEKGYCSIVFLAISKQIELETWDLSKNVVFQKFQNFWHIFYLIQSLKDNCSYHRFYIKKSININKTKRFLVIQIFLIGIFAHQQIESQWIHFYMKLLFSFTFTGFRVKA